MAPPLPLSTVAGTLALSFTAGRAAPTTASAPVQEPTSVPTPPVLPPMPGETVTTEPATAEPATPEPGATVTTEPATPEPATPEPAAEVEPLMPIPPPAIDDIELPDGDDTTADANRLLRPNHRKFMFNLFVGGSRTLRGGEGYSFLNDFNVEGAIGGFGPKFRAGGFAVVQMSKGLPFTTFTLAPRLSLNRQIVPDHAFYFTTNLTVGYRAFTYRDSSNNVYDGYGNSYGGGRDERTTYHSAMMGVSWGASAIIAERLVLSFRPVDVEMVIHTDDQDDRIQLNWCVMGGVGVVWGGPGDDNR